MNSGQLNGYALNGSVGDPVVRIRIDAKGYAQVRSGGRVLSYGKVHVALAARMDGVLGRVRAQLSARSVAQAFASGALGRVDLHGILRATGRAVIEVQLPPIRGMVRARGRATAVVKAHLEARGGIAAGGRAAVTSSGRLLRRGPVGSKPAAQGQATGTVYIRRYLRTPTEGRAKAFIIGNGRIEARLAALVRARAVPTTTGRALVRAPRVWHGVAVIDIDPAIFRRLPFDELAPDSRTFTIPAGMTTFYVTDQGISMFKTSPMQPADTQDYDIEFAEWFPPGDEIISVSLKVSTPAMPVPPSYAIQGQRVKVWVYAGGTSGRSYKISVLATTNDGRAKEVDLTVPIKEV